MNTGNPTGDKHLDIRKYPNRRYYDATHSRHLTLEEIRSFIRDGYDIQVTDSKTGADITAQVLAQIILELETPKLDAFPVNLLLRLIRVNDQLVKDFIEKYFNQAFQSWLEYQKQFEERVRQVQGMPGVYSPFSALTQAIMRPFSPPYGSPSTEKTAPSQPPPNAQQDTGDLRNIIKDLQQQVSGLRQEVKKTKSKRSKR